MNDFIGSLNPQDLVFKTNNIEKLRIRSSVSSTGALLFVNGGDMIVNGMTVGHGSGASSTNTAIGNSSLSAVLPNYLGLGQGNTALGDHALFANTTGQNNTANGASSLYSNTTGYFNTANGASSLYSNTTGWANTANGYLALFANTTGPYNTANGYAALYYNGTG